jgi:hypothetical protein
MLRIARPAPLSVKYIKNLLKDWRRLMAKVIASMHSISKATRLLKEKISRLHIRLLLCQARAEWVKALSLPTWL